MLAIVTGPWRRAREHAEAVALAADLDLERVFAEMRADLERGEVLDYLAAEELAGVPPPLALAGWSLEEARGYVAAFREAAATLAPPPVPSRPSEPSLDEVLAGAARAIGVDPRVYAAATLGRSEQWRATA